MEIATEMKKVTLAHDIGAGASCLKCKDKCEGFELHFWRKICRNCKCGLEDHDVQMESAENKKVGRLFADTKYTGLIDKLKTGGPYAADKSHQVRPPSTAAKTWQNTARADTAQVVYPRQDPAGPGAAGPGAAGPGAAGPGGAGPGAAGPGGARPEAARPEAARPNAARQDPARPDAARQDAAHQDPTRQDPTRQYPAGPGAARPGAAGQDASRQDPAWPDAARQDAARQDPARPDAACQVAARPDAAKLATLEWTPRGTNKHLVTAYIQLLPPERRPIAGTAGAEYRKRQMARQLPEHDQDPSCCHELSPGEVKVMQQYVKKCKTEALGMGDLKLPEEMAAVVMQAEGGGETTSCPGTDTKNAKGPDSGPEQGSRGTISKIGSAGGQKNIGSGPPRTYLCNQCNQPMKEGEPAVYADRAGYDRLWHPACFVCCTCTELLVDMIYFWKKDKLYCGRHYGESEKPRCGGCDELIFSNEYTQAEGQNWHLKHFCCFDCDCVLAGQTYVMEDIHPVCETCYMKNHAVKCVACDLPIEPEAQRVSYGDSHWHAEPQCFQCGGCSKCLIGQRFMVVKNKLCCSVECKKACQ